MDALARIRHDPGESVNWPFWAVFSSLRHHAFAQGGPGVWGEGKILFEDIQSFLLFLKFTWNQPLMCPAPNMNSLMPCCAMMMSWKGAGLPLSYTWFIPGTGAWGGTLDQYNIDEHFQLKQTVKSHPFYLQCPFTRFLKSCQEKSCLSTSGQFHGPLTRPPNYFEPLIPWSPHIPQDHEILYDWINLPYLDMDYQVRTQEEFEESSEILLKREPPRPPNKRFYEKDEESKLPSILKECMKLFCSEALFLLLSNFTGLKLPLLAPLEDEIDDKKEEVATSAADRTKEGTGHSPPEPENNQVAISNNSQQ
ncbi:Prolyl 3-hydroxylase OGFOD1 [Plecturocebus cupreus]